MAKRRKGTPVASKPINRADLEDAFHGLLATLKNAPPKDRRQLADRLFGELGRAAGKWAWYDDPQTGKRRDWYCEDVLSGGLEIRKVWEDDRVLAFHHRDPTAPIHVVVIPKIHVSSVLDPMALNGDLLSSMVRAVQETARSLGLDQTGFFVRTNAAAPGVTPHMHWHVMGPGMLA